MTTRRLACALALLTLLVAAPGATAQAPLVPPTNSVGTGSTSWGPLQWNEGTVATDITQSCLFGEPQVEQLGGSWLSWYGDLGVSPQVNQTFYVRMSWFVSGFPCGTGSAYVAPEFALPRATSLAVTTGTPVRCFVRLDDARGWQEFSRAECPQAPTSTGRGGGMAFNPPDGGWPTASGVGFEVWIPVKATQPLTGDSPNAQFEGCPNCLYGGAWFIDGVHSPFMRPNVFVYTGPGGTATGSATAPRINYPVPNHYRGAKSQNPFLAANQQADCVQNTSTSSSWVTGEVYSRAEGGSAYFEFGTGHPTGAPTYTVTKNNGAPTDQGAPAGDWRYDLCVLNFPAGNAQPLPPGDYHYRLCWDPGAYNATSTTGDVCGPDQEFSVADPSESTPPTTTIVRKPPATSSPDVTFTFRSNEPGSTFECSLDGAAFKPCLVLELKGLAPGSHTLRVRAKDPAGNVDASPESYTWTVANGGSTQPPPPPPPSRPTPTPTPVGPGPDPVQPDPVPGPAGESSCTVPKLKGKTLKQAKKMLKRAGCKVGKVKRKKARGKKKIGRVLSSRPKAGKKLKLGAKVALVVGRR